MIQTFLLFFFKEKVNTLLAILPHLFYHAPPPQLGAIPMISCVETHTPPPSPSHSPGDGIENL
jgi:hypothetical protein